MASPPLAPWDQRAYDAALERGGELSELMNLFDDLCADRGFCAAQGYAPEDSLGRHFRKGKDSKIKIWNKRVSNRPI